jgi:hypothetical protein
MSAGGSHNQTVIPPTKDVYIPPMQHPYGYTTARCLRCGTQLNFAQWDDAQAWLDDHAAAHKRLDTLDEDDS